MFAVSAPCRGRTDLAAGAVASSRWARHPLGLLLLAGFAIPAAASAPHRAGPADAPMLYAGTVSGHVMLIDTATGAGEILGAVKTPCLFGGTTEIEYDFVTGRAFAHSGGHACGTEVDLRRGGEYLGDSIFTPSVFSGLEVVDGTWYGAGQDRAQGPSTLWTLDPFAAMWSVVGATGVGPISGLAWDPGRQVLFGVEGGGGISRLLTLDLSLGTATVVGSTGIRAGSLEFGPDGRLYAGTGGPAGGDLYVIDPDTGAGTLVGPTGLVEPISSLVTAPAPVVRPPLIQIAKLEPVDGQEGDEYGWDVAVDGDTIVVGAPHRYDQVPAQQGRVFVYRIAGRAVEQVAELCASDDDELDFFGSSVAIDGDVIVAGAPARGATEVPGEPGVPRKGAAYIFVKPPGGWVSACESAKIQPSEALTRPLQPLPQPHFGASVAIRDDLIVAGTPALLSGTARLFVKPPGGWTSGTETATLAPSDPEEPLLSFGTDVAISEDHTVGVTFPEKGLYLFESPPGGWTNATETAKLTPSDVEQLDVGFYRIALSDSVAATSRQVTSASQPFESDYLFERPTSGWETAPESAKIVDSQTDGSDHHRSVALQGDRLLVGVTRYPIAAGGVPAGDPTAVFNHGFGSLDVYERPPGGWVTTTRTDGRVLPSDSTPADDFGDAMAAGGAVVVAGRYRDENYRGSVYVFLDKSIFADGFESGDTAAWSAAVPGGG